MSKRKVTFTFYADDGKKNGVPMEHMVTARRIRMAALERGENFADWARSLGVTRQAIWRVVNGVSKSERVRTYIENRLGITFWS